MATNSHDHGHGDDSGYVNPESIKTGHEPDKIEVRSILMVPLALVATFILAYLVVNTLINYVRAPSKEAPANNLAAIRNEEPINTRFDRISSTEKGAEYKQPRLEGLYRVEGNDSPFWRSMNPTPTGNSPHYHPEDMRLDSEHARELGLDSYAWANKEKNIVRIPVTKALEIALNMKDPNDPKKSLFPTIKDPISVESIKLLRPKASNPQWGSASAVPSAHPHDKKETPKGNH